MSEDKDVGVFSVIPQEAKDALSKATGVDAFKKGLPTFQMREDDPLYAGLFYRLFAGMMQVAFPTLYAYSKYLHEGGKAERWSRAVTPSEEKTRDPFRIPKMFGAVLVDIGVDAFAGSLATTGNPDKAFMFKFWFGNVLGGAAAEQVFRSLGKGNVPQPASGLTATR